MTIVGYNLLEIKQKVIAKKIYLLVYLNLPLMFRLTFFLLLYNGNILFNFPCIFLNFYVLRLIMLSLFVCTIFLLLIVLNFVLLNYLDFLYVIRVLEMLFFLTFATSNLLLKLFFLLKVYHFDSFLLAMLPLHLFAFLFSVMIILSFAPSKAQLLMDWQP